MGRKEKRRAAAQARKHPDRFARAGYSARCWACGNLRSTFAEGGQIRVRDDCGCPPPPSVTAGSCVLCDVTGGHAHHCPTLAKKDPTDDE